MPSARHGLTGPERTDLVCSVIADGENKAEVRRVRLGELVPRFAACICRAKPRLLNLANGLGSTCTTCRLYGEV